jgi:hypothetical protein
MRAYIVSRLAPASRPGEVAFADYRILPSEVGLLDATLNIVFASKAASKNV